MIQFDLTYVDLKNNLNLARKGMIIIDTDSKDLTRYIIKDVINGSPILIQIGDKYKTILPNWIGDYMLNLRTGYISLIGKDYKITDPINDKRLNDIALASLREEYIP